MNNNIELQNLYLNLIRNCLLNTIYEDPDINHEGFSPISREMGRAWPSKAHTMIGNQRMLNLQSLANKVLQSNIPGDFVEAGVWRGGACIFLRAILKAWNRTDRKIWVADSFQGLPSPTHPSDIAEGNHSTIKELAIPLEQVKENFKKYGLLDEQVHFLEGWFKDTLPTAPIDKIAILRLDGDMYESTINILESLYRKVSVGGFVIVDDYGAMPSCKEATNYYRQKMNIHDPIEIIDETGIFWQKTGNE